jgi:hypothetical protein
MRNRVPSCVKPPESLRKGATVGAPGRRFEGHPQLRQRANDARWPHKLCSCVNIGRADNLIDDVLNESGKTREQLPSLSHNTVRFRYLGLH